MKIQIYNSLHNKLEEFKPIEPGVVRMYSCGPTVYDYAHIGNFRTFLFGDLIRRFFELVDYKVHHVMNITDVGHMTEDDAEGGEDRMIVAIERMKTKLENKKDGSVPEGAVEDPNNPYHIAQYYIDSFLIDARALGYKVAYEYPDNMPRATDHIDGMIRMIGKLIEKDHAYLADDGVVYFDVESFSRYGELSGNTLEELQSGAGGRVSDENQAMKRHPADFMLWKADSNHIMKWDSPWGTGYPGWHIECSVMARDLLKSDVIDIHTGGEDLIFPHHECEIAQTCGVTDQSTFANYWIHARFLMVEGKKMSKSAGTFFTVQDVLEGRAFDSKRKVDPAVLRFELLKSHYRSNLNFTAKGLTDSANSVRRLQEFRRSLEESTGGEAAEIDLSHPVLNEFASALADDLNIAAAIAVVLPWAASKPTDPHEALSVLKRINSVLAVAPITEGLEPGEPARKNDDVDSEYQQAEQWCKELDAARASKDFTKADSLRTQINDAGFEVRTTKEGSTIQKQLV